MKLFLSIIMGLSTVTTFTATAKTMDELSAWVVANRTEFDSYTSEQAKAKMKAFFADKLAGKRFVFIGEADHYFHEKYQYRELILSALIEMGYTNLTNEFGYTDSKKISQYLQTGDESHIKRVCFYGFCESSPALNIFGSEELRFYRNLYKIANTSGKKLTHHGWDLNYRPMASIPEIRRELNKIKETSASEIVGKLLSMIQLEKGESIIQASERIYKAHDLYSSHKEELLKVMTPSEYYDLYWEIRTTADSWQIVGQGLDLSGKLAKDPNNKELQFSFYQYFLLREPTGFDRFRFLVENSPKEAKFVVMGHNSHLAKSTMNMTMSYQSLKDFPMWKSIGEMIAVNYPGEVFQIWMGIGQGKYGYEVQPCWGQTPCPSVPVPGTIEENFAAHSTGPWIVALKDAPMQKRVTWSAQFTEKESGDLKKASDAYFFIPNTQGLARRDELEEKKNTISEFLFP